MKRRWSALVAALVTAVVVAPPSRATTPLEQELDRLAPVTGTAGSVDMAVVGRRLLALTPTGLLGYDITRPEQPVLAGRLDLPARRFRQSLQVSPDGRLALVRDSGLIAGGADPLHVVDVRSSAAMRVVTSVAGFREIPFCLAGCRWVYGSGGTVLDLRDPARPRVAGLAGTSTSWVKRAYRDHLQIRSVREVRPGLVTTAPVKGVFDDRFLQLHVLDVRNPLRPKVVRSATSTSERHSFPDAVWPAAGTSRFQLVQSIFNGEDLFCTSPAPLLVYDTRAAVAAKPVGQYTPKRGSYVDGSPAANPRLSCGGGRLDLHPGHGTRGGLLLSAQLEHGVRVLRLDGRGALTEPGWALTPSGSTDLALWADERVVYALDESRGIDVFRYTGPLTS
jgi:hypothetical protein